MEIKRTQLVPRGMQQDLSLSKFNSEFSYENRNIRISAREDSSLLSITNERGNTALSFTSKDKGTAASILGTCIGYASLNNYIILFTTSKEGVDRIYRIKDLKELTLMFEGNLNFSLEHLIDTLPIYESESVQKVYWTDSYNQPRVINFINDPEPSKWNEQSYYDFSPSMTSYSSIDVTKNHTGGEFAPGVIQYAFTYITDWHGVESNIVDVSSLNYISLDKRAAKKDETCYNSFNIRLSGLDPRYKYVRLYSIHRTSLDATPTVKILGEFTIQLPEEFPDYWAIRKQVKEAADSVEFSPYAKATWSDQLPKLDDAYDTFSNAINSKFEVNIGTVGNGIFTLQEVFEYIWKRKAPYVEITDTGLIGTNEDPTVLLYKNSSEAVVTTMAAKDSALFVGGYSIPSEAKIEKDYIKVYQNSDANIIPLKVTHVYEDNYLASTIITVDSAISTTVASRVPITISYSPSGKTVSSSFLPHTNSLVINSPTATEVSGTVKIPVPSGQSYYQDDRYIYYLKDIDSYPGDNIILKGSDGSFKWEYRDYIKVEDSTEIGTYTYKPYTLDNESSLCKQFKKGQPYRFAIQGQYANGRWGDPIVLKNLENSNLLFNEEGKIQDSSITEGLYVLDNTCPISFLIDPVLSQKSIPQYTLTDVIETKPAGSLDVSSNLVTKTNLGIRGNLFDVTKPPLTAGFWYVPTNAYLVGDSSPVSSITETTNFEDLPNPWKLIYNKDNFNIKWNGKNVPIDILYNRIYFQTNYTINNKYFFSLWTGNLKRPQTSSFPYSEGMTRGTGGSDEFPEGAKRFPHNIPNNSFEGNFTTLYLNKLVVTLGADKCKELYNKGYRRIRLLYVIPTKANRKYPAQGIVTNTVFLPALRAQNACWAYTDYLSRPKEVYRVWDEESGFFKNWSQKVGEMKLFMKGSTQTWNTAKRFTASPFFFPDIHRFYTSDKDPFNTIWNTRPNYGHLMSTYNEVGGSSERAISNSSSYNNFPNRSTSLAFNYSANNQLFKPCITVDQIQGAESNKDYIAFDENIVDFWSPDIEYQEVDKNYFENTVEGFQIRGMSCVVSTTNSDYIIKEDGTTLGTLGYADTSNYYPFQDLNSIGEKGSSTFNKTDYTQVSKVSYLTNPQLYSVASSVHRLYVGGLGEWSINAAKARYSHIWEDLGVSSESTGTDKKNKSSQHSFKKYCLNTLMFKELSRLYYDINQPSLFIKGDSIKPISYYKTAYSGEDVTYNPGMNELLFKADSYNIPIQYKANTHLTFSLAKGNTIVVHKETQSGAEEVNVSTLPVMPELSAYAKYYNNKQIIGEANGKLVYLNLYWWPSKKSFRPDIYQNEAYSVSESQARNERYNKWKIALEASMPLPVDVTIKVTYNLGFWKSDKVSNTGSINIVLPAGQTSTLLKFSEDFFTLRNWSTINIISKEIIDAGNWTINSSRSSINNNSSVNKTIAVLVSNNTYINSEATNTLYTDPYWLGDTNIYTKEVFDPIQGELLAPEYDNVGMQSIIYHRNLPHFLLVDLVRSDALLYSDWTDSGIYQQIWTPCGKPSVIPLPDSNENCIIEATEGDTYVGRYDCLRVSSDSEKTNKVNDIVSFICESYVNPDGRSDVNRYLTDTRAVNLDNWNLHNPVYSQTNNFFNYNKNDYRVLEQSGKFPNQISWTLPKYPDSLVDNWANLTFASTYNLNGEYGKLTKIINYNNQLYAFQDKAISNILYNTRVQIPVSDGLPIELGNSNKVDGVRYISTESGAQNKWAINSTRSGIYYIDNNKQCINLMSSEGIKDLTGSMHFTKWALNNLGYSNKELSLASGMTNWQLSKDTIHDDVYIHDRNECLSFSERLASFTSFFDYKNVPFMFTHDNHFLSIYSTNDSTKIYDQNTGTYNKFFGYPKVPSYIDYVVNPEVTRDKVFNNIEFRADAFSKGNGEYDIYNSIRTLDHIHVRNEFQDSGNVTLTQYNNLQKKFRTWRAYIPRDVKEVSNYKLNRIRNPWIKMKLSYIPTEVEDNKLVLHDLIVNYTV